MSNSKRCPFCGNLELEVDEMDLLGVGDCTIHTICNGCGASAPSKIWNERNIGQSKIKGVKMSHIDRMKAEHKEPKTKVDAWNAFIYKQEDSVFDTLYKDERVRMIQQLTYMKGYLRILDSRLWAAHGNK